MAIEKKHEQEHENEERWLLTYADLITLLMVFFVVMYAMSKSDVAKFQQMAETMAAAFSNPMGSKTGFQARLPKVQAARADLAQSSKGTDPRKR
ncbi:MAG: flagellar motor protein MotB, partial [Candidatus Hydrogenedentes bacterium]|nr:flagellar motor protein MotB [Candidatus Hydrogenedentota bacterium]